MSEHNSQEIQRLNDYLAANVSPKGITRGTKNFTMQIWNSLSLFVPNLPTPECVISPDGQAIISWGIGSRHLEVKVSSGGTTHTTYRNLDTEYFVLWEGAVGSIDMQALPYFQFLVGGADPPEQEPIEALGEAVFAHREIAVNGKPSL